ncbi:MAG: hypothetical protein JWM11_2385 [Planctomycetaceae bacterium]|nr:hypothetical protein [Planctomycetaceae bacterium]
MRHHTILGQLGTAFSLSLGYLCLHVLGFFFLGVLLQPFFSVPADQLPSRIVVSEGQPLKWLPWQLTHTYEFATLDGQRVQMREKQSFSVGTSLNAPKEPWRDAFTLRPVSWNMIQFFLMQDQRTEWYFVQERRGEQFTGYFVVYSHQTRKPIAYIGQDGEMPEPPLSAQRFQLVPGQDLELRADMAYTDGGTTLAYNSQVTALDTGCFTGNVAQDYVVLMTQRGIEHVHLRNRQVEPILLDKTLVSMASNQLMEYTQGTVVQKSNPGKYTLLVRNVDTVYQYDNQHLTAKYRIPEELRDQVLNVHPIDANTIFYEVPIGPQPHLEWQLQKRDAGGHILQTEDVRQPGKRRMSVEMQTSMAFAVLNPMPLQSLVTLGVLIREATADRVHFIREVWPSCVLLAICGAVSAFVALWLIPRHGADGTRIHWAWLMYVILLGVPGLVGYLMHFRHRFHAKLAPAPQLGTEIFG